MGDYEELKKIIIQDYRSDSYDDDFEEGICIKEDPDDKSVLKNMISKIPNDDYLEEKLLIDQKPITNITPKLLEDSNVIELSDSLSDHETGCDSLLEHNNTDNAKLLSEILPSVKPTRHISPKLLKDSNVIVLSDSSSDRETGCDSVLEHNNTDNANLLSENLPSVVNQQHLGTANNCNYNTKNKLLNNKNNNIISYEDKCIHQNNTLSNHKITYDSGTTLLPKTNVSLNSRSVLRVMQFPRHSSLGTCGKYGMAPSVIQSSCSLLPEKYIDSKLTENNRKKKIVKRTEPHSQTTLDKWFNKRLDEGYNNHKSNVKNQKMPINDTFNRARNLGSSGFRNSRKQSNNSISFVNTQHDTDLFEISSGDENENSHRYQEPPMLSSRKYGLHLSDSNIPQLNNESINEGSNPCTLTNTPGFNDSSAHINATDLSAPCTLTNNSVLSIPTTLTNTLTLSAPSTLTNTSVLSVPNTISNTSTLSGPSILNMPILSVPSTNTPALSVPSTDTNTHILSVPCTITNTQALSALPTVANTPAHNASSIVVNTPVCETISIFSNTSSISASYSHANTSSLNTPIILDDMSHSKQSVLKKLDGVASTTRKHAGSIFCECYECKINKCVSKETSLSVIKCNECDITFSTKQCLKKHLDNHLGLKNHVCAQCCRGFSTKYSLEDHMKMVHSTSERLKCPSCEKLFKGPKSLTLHIKTYHTHKASTPTSCDLCQKMFKNKNRMREHRRLVHNSCGAKFICNDCSAVYRNRDQFINHAMTHMPPSVKCTMCSELFHNEQKLAKHMRIQHLIDNRKTFICDVCGKTTKSKFSLEIHMFIHKEEKPHICEECGKSFRTASNLVQHSFSHSDKRPFSCDHCGKSFRIRHHLRQHMVVHGLNTTPKYGKRKL